MSPSRVPPESLQPREPSSEVRSRIPSSATPPPAASAPPLLPRAEAPPAERDPVLRILAWLTRGPVSAREVEMTRRAHWRLA